MYATYADMLARFGERELIQLTDRTLTGAPDQVLAEGVLEEASAEIDGFIGTRYDVPLPTVPRILVGYCCDIARYRLCGAEVQTTESIRDRYQDARRFLELVAAGKVGLGGMPGGAGVAPAAGDSVKIASGRSVFRGEW